MNLNTMTDLEIKNLLIDLQAEVEKRVNSSPKKKTIQKEAEELSSLVAELDNSLELTFDLDIPVTMKLTVDGPENLAHVFYMFQYNNDIPIADIKLHIGYRKKEFDKLTKVQKHLIEYYLKLNNPLSLISLDFLPSKTIKNIDNITNKIRAKVEEIKEAGLFEEVNNHLLN